METIADVTDVLEDLSMELTENLGKTLAQSSAPATPSPKAALEDPILPPSVTIQRGKSPKSKSPATRKSPASAIRPARKSPRKSLALDLGPDSKASRKQAQEKLEAQTMPLQLHPATAPLPLIIEPPEAAITQPIPRPSSLAESLRMLATPRKEILTNPSLRPPFLAEPKSRSPKKPASPAKATPRAARFAATPSPRKRVRIDASASPDKAGPLGGDDGEAEVISLPQFLDMTNIRFMDLTTTKRRATGHPGAAGFLGNEELMEDGPEPSFENNVAAAVGIVPPLVMYQHVS
jgi:kinetochore protein Spc7/SPC105